MEINESDKIKAVSFVQRLAANPALQNFSILQREEQLIQFLIVNSRQLYPTLSSSAFFAGRDWDSIWKILQLALQKLTNEELVPEVRRIISTMDLTFFTFLRNQAIDYAKVNDLLDEYLFKALELEPVRRSMTGTLVALKADVVGKFVSEIFNRKKYIHFELAKVERLKLGEKEIANMIIMSMLMRPLVYLFSPKNTVMKNTANGHVFLSPFTRQVAATLAGRSPYIPEQVFLSAMNSNASFSDDPSIEGTSRLANIFTAMCRNYKPGLKQDRGADSAFKSWINVARKNYKFYGYDLKMLDELYNIAADNGW